MINPFEYRQLNTLKDNCIRGYPRGPRGLNADSNRRPSTREFLRRLAKIANDAQTSASSRRRILDSINLMRSPHPEENSLWHRLRSTDADVVVQARCALIHDLSNPNAEELKREIRQMESVFDIGYKSGRRAERLESARSPIEQETARPAAEIVEPQVRDGSLGRGKKAIRKNLPPQGRKRRKRTANAPAIAKTKRVGRPKEQPVDAKKLYKYRERSGLTQELFAEKVGVSLITIQRFESGKSWIQDTFEMVARGISDLLTIKVKPQALYAKPVRNYS